MQAITCEKEIQSTFNPSLRGGFYHMWLYCNIISALSHPDKNVPILRIIPVRNKNDDYIIEMFKKVYYAPLITNTFSSISFELRDSTGKLVAFENGEIFLKLHFRKTL